MDWKEEFKKMLNEGKFTTDSDIEDFADERNLDWGEVFDYLAVLEMAGTPCEGCRYIGFRYSMYPCNTCSRRPDIIDRYEPQEEEKEC